MKFLFIVFLIGLFFIVPVYADLFPEIKDWKKVKNVEIYGSENLYEHINGAAELYFSYSFEELQIGEYLNRDSVSILIEIYRHTSPEHAFGIYSQERPYEGNFLEIGGQGYIQESMLNFVAAEYYVKISSYDLVDNSNQVLKEFGTKIANNLTENAKLPQILSWFPVQNKKLFSEKFIAKNFLGYAFLHSAFTADYDLNGSTFTLFIIKAKEKQECIQIVNLYLDRLDLKANSGPVTVKDPYHGEIILNWKSNCIWGVLDQKKEEMRLRYFQLLEYNVNTQIIVD